MKTKIIFLGIAAGLTLMVGILAIVFIGIIGFFTGNAFEGTGSESSTGASGYDCAGVAFVPSAYYPWVKDAANLRLNGDEAALIALIQIESGWRPDAKAGSSSASGLGQFLTSTAQGMTEFIGGTDDMGKIWPAGQVFDDPENHKTDDARFDPERSIYATAHKLGGHMKDNGGDLASAYIESYHGYCKDMSDPKCVAQKNAAEAGAKSLMDKYNEIINGGGCKLKGQTACGVVRVSDADANLNASHPELMPPAAADFNKLAKEYYEQTGKKLGITGMFRTREEQEKLCGGLKSDGKCNNPLANPPGSSMHEAGLAMDINAEEMSLSEYETFKTLALKYNFKVASSSGGVKSAAEAWHFDYTALDNQYWYGEPKISNAIAAANSCGGSETVLLSIIHKISINLYGGVK